MPKNIQRERRRRMRRKIREKVHGTPERPRLCVFRSNKEIYAQVIDDTVGETLVSASSRAGDVGSEAGTKMDVSHHVGKVLGERLQEIGIKRVVFDRNVYRYHGRVKALAEGVREAGIQV